LAYALNGVPLFAATPHVCQFVAHWNDLRNELLTGPKMGGGALKDAAEMMRKNGGIMMRVLGSSTQKMPSPTPASGAVGDTCDEATGLPAQGLRHGSKLKTSIEKKIENIWLESEQLGWTYSDFVSHLIEILIVLNYRGFRTKLTPNKNKKATAS
jgi:hypothetical protein